jgi:hypothetical protein
MCKYFINKVRNIFNDNQNSLLQKVSCKLIMVWMSIIILPNIIISFQIDNKFKFYNTGASSELIILGYAIDNYYKYSFLIFYIIINSIIRRIANYILNPWLINNVYDITYIKYHKNNKLSYEITLVTTLYTWFDWYINLNLLLTQIDIFLIDMVSELFTAAAITKYYLMHNKEDIKLNEIITRISNQI